MRKSLSQIKLNNLKKQKNDILSAKAFKGFDYFYNSLNQSKLSRSESCTKTNTNKEGLVAIILF